MIVGEMFDNLRVFPHPRHLNLINVEEGDNNL
jgi:hypothetical protein